MALTCPTPATMAASRMTATRVTSGAICLSGSNHFALKLYSKSMRPVALPPGHAKLSDEPGFDWVGDHGEHDRHTVRAAWSSGATESLPVARITFATSPISSTA